MFLIRFEKFRRLDSFQSAHHPTCSQVSASHPNQSIYAQEPATSIGIPVARDSQPSLHPMHLPLQYHEPLPWPILRKEKPPEILKKKSMSYQNASSWAACTVGTQTSNITQHQWSKTEALGKMISGAHTTSQTRAEFNPYTLNYHKHWSDMKASKWKYN